MTEPRNDAINAAEAAIEAMLPESAVCSALTDFSCSGKTVLVAVGKAAWRMADAAYKTLGEKISRGVVITKDGHSMGAIGDFEIYETAHPVPDERTPEAARKAVAAVSGLSHHDKVLFLVSGGGSALFELPLDGISLSDIADVTKQLLACGADIVEINTIRKRLSSVKGGRFAELCRPAEVEAIILSDVLGDRLDTIASGPAYPDCTTSEQALYIVKKYSLNLRDELIDRVLLETPKRLEGVTVRITGSCSELCAAAEKELRRMGYKVLTLTTTLCSEAREAGSIFASIAREIENSSRPLPAPCAVIMGGETIVHLKGNGKGGRNQEIALAAAIGMSGLKNAAFISVGSDGTDGPTDAAGGIVDGGSAQRMKDSGVNPNESLDNNDAYNALSSAGDLVITGATGTNVNDISILICG